MEKKNMDLNDGKFLVNAARNAIKAHLSGEPVRISFPKWCEEKRGVFVTLQTGDGQLRGCIGFPLPVYPLKKSLATAAISAATGDPRFPQVTLKEFDNLIVEVSVLTVPERIKNPSENALNEIVIGRDGLIIEKGPFSGLLLPQVPVEWGWSVEEFLAHTCMKAGLSSGCWRGDGVKLSKFSAEVFAESEPAGRIVKKDLMEK